MPVKELSNNLKFDYTVEIIYHTSSQYGDYFSYKLTIGNEVFYLKPQDNDKRLLVRLLKDDFKLKLEEDF